jgi:GT2 family glycosyltransferase
VSGLAGALLKAEGLNRLYIVDNSPVANEAFRAAGVSSDFDASEKTVYIFNGGNNLGYGRAHNIAIRESIRQNVEYHLVVNPDVMFEPEIFSEIIRYMSENKDVGLLSPKIFSPTGELQYQCKLLPTPTDLLLRRFIPSGIALKRRNRYELRHSLYSSIMNVPYLQGCFMFFRTAALADTGLFDERFFMYPEDIDLTRRLHRRYRTIFYPSVSIVHAHERASYKSLKMMLIHAREIVKYFNKWGWFYDPERRKFNASICAEIVKKEQKSL